MTAHPEKPTINPQIVARFADYHRRHPAWGVFHVVLDDGNYGCTSADFAATDEERELAAILDAFTISQRRRLEKRIAALEKWLATR